MHAETTAAAKMHTEDQIGRRDRVRSVFLWAIVLFCS